MLIPNRRSSRRTIVPNLALLFLPLLTGPLHGQLPRGSIAVTVTDSVTGEPLPGTEVAVSGGRYRASTDSSGVAQLTGVEAGERLLDVRRLDRVALRRYVRVEPDATTRLHVRLASDAIALDPLTVETEAAPRSPRLREFYARVEKSSSGYFVTREQIEARKLRRFTDAFRGIPNLQIISQGADGSTIRMNRNVASITDRDCPPIYYVDGVPFALGAGPSSGGGSTIPLGPDPTSGGGQPTERSPDREFSLKEIEGIEVYPGTNVPARYAGSKARCGVIVVWTRERG